MFAPALINCYCNKFRDIRIISWKVFRHKTELKWAFISITVTSSIIQRKWFRGFFSDSPRGFFPDSPPTNVFVC